jgi:hypothetical protein
MVVTVATASAITYAVTKRLQDAKYTKLLFERYQDEKRAKEVTAGERKAAKEPVGTVTEDVQILRVYVWTCEDLRRRFPSANVENMMVNKASSTARRTTHSRLVRGASSSSTGGSLSPSSAPPTEDTKQPYNKLIDDKQVILAEVVRKPSMPPHTVGYMRAGTCSCREKRRLESLITRSLTSTMFTSLSHSLHVNFLAS